MLLIDIKYINLLAIILFVVYFFLVDNMVIISDGNSENGAHVRRKKVVVLVTGFCLNKCLKQIKFPISLLSCAPLSDLPFSLSTKGSRDQIPTDLQHVVCKGTNLTRIH